MAQKDDDKEYYNKVFGTGGGDWDWGQLIIIGLCVYIAFFKD